MQSSMFDGEADLFAPVEFTGERDKKRWTRQEDVTLCASFLRGDFSCDRSEGALADRANAVRADMELFFEDVCFDINSFKELEDYLSACAHFACCMFKAQDSRFLEIGAVNAAMGNLADWVFGIPSAPKKGTLAICAVSYPAFQNAVASTFWRIGKDRQLASALEDFRDWHNG